MKSIFTVGICTLTIMIAAPEMSAQVHFTFTANTGSNATVGVPNTSNPDIAGTPLESGDEIGAFTPGGLCVGACVWTGTTTAITVWADDPLTPAKDGMASGEQITYHIWDKSTNLEYPYVDVSYSQGDGVFQSNGVYVLSSISATGVLPVELTSFKADNSLRGTTLSWSTATELNNYGFDVERSAAGGTQWEKIGFVEGSGTANRPHAYSFVDRTADDDHYVYRLKQIDRDGKFSYSKIIEASGDRTPTEFRLSQNFPNPFNPSTVIGFDLPRETFVRLTVYDLLGRQVASLIDGVMSAGHQMAVFDGSQLPDGMYLYKLEAGTFTMVRRMMLVK